MSALSTYVLDPSYSPWIWLIIGGLLLTLELAAPGVFMLWLGLAAVTVGLFCIIWPLSWLIAVPLFAVLSLVYVYAGRPYYNARKVSSDPHLNQRQNGYLGQRYTLAEPIINHRGRLLIDDVPWQVQGPNLPAGTPVIVTRIDGAILHVAPV